jgi:hypothetical protein
VLQRAAAPGNSNQRNLCRAVAAMPLGAAATAAGAPPSKPASHSDAQSFVTDRVKALLGR